MLIRIGETLAIIFDTVILKEFAKGDDRAGLSGRKRYRFGKKIIRTL